MTNLISRNKFMACMFGAAAAIALIAVPVKIDGTGQLALDAAYAKSGKDDVVKGKGKKSEAHGRKNSNKGKGKGKHSGDDDDDDDDNDDDNGNDDLDDDKDGNEHVNPKTGVKVEITGRNIEVEYPSGVEEEIENGLYEKKNANGRTIIERPATAKDRARLLGLAP